MATQAAIRTRVRDRLGETSAAIWSDQDLDEAIEATVEEYNFEWRYEATTTSAVSAGATTINAPSGLLVLVRVELANGTIVERRRRNVAGSRSTQEAQAWELYGGVIRFTRALEAQTVTLWYLRAHAVTEVPDEDVGLIVAGAAWRALEMRSVDDLRRQGVMQQQRHGLTVEAARRDYDRLLDRRRRRIGVR